MRTYNAKPGDIEARWFIVDLQGKTLGRAASAIATMLMGKNKPAYTPHVDTGDYVVAINADKIKLTGSKLKDKKYYRHSRWMGSLVETSAGELLQKDPTKLIQFAVKGMLPKSRLGGQMFSKLKVHAGACPEHGYVAQKAETLEL
jgi:large subunit ribosomal protein L13